MDPTDDVQRTLYRITIARDNFRWAPSRMQSPPGTTAYEGSLGPVNLVVIRYKIDGIEMLGIPHGGFGYDGVIRTGMNVIHMPPDMAEDFFKTAVSKVSTA